MNQDQAIDSAARPVHSPAWIFQVYATFGIAICAMGVGILALPVDVWTRAFLGMGLLLTIMSSVTMAKTVRDNFEATRVSSKVEEARLERFLSEHDPVRV